MTTSLSTHNRFPKVVAIILSIALSFSLIPLDGWRTLSGVVYAPPAPTNPTSTLLEHVNPPTTQASQNSLPSELAQQLTGLGVLSQDSEPANMLMNIDSMQADVLHEPASYANPVSISRVQSAYRAADAISGMLMITFTVTSHHPSHLHNCLSRQP